MFDTPLERRLGCLRSAGSSASRPVPPGRHFSPGGREGKPFGRAFRPEPERREADTAMTRAPPARGLDQPRYGLSRHHIHRGAAPVGGARHSDGVDQRPHVEVVEVGQVAIPWRVWRDGALGSLSAGLRRRAESQQGRRLGVGVPRRRLFVASHGRSCSWRSRALCGSGRRCSGCGFCAALRFGPSGEKGTPAPGVARNTYTPQPNGLRLRRRG